MRGSQLWERYTLGACALVAMLAGCASQQPVATNGSPPQLDFYRAAAPLSTPLPPPPRGPRPRGWLSPEAKRPTHGLLYVADEYGSEVLIYPAKGKHQSPIGMIDDGVATPWGLWMDKNRNLYVANQGSYYSSGSGSVTVYPPGSTSPSQTYLQDLGRPLYPIVDQYGDLFVSGINYNGSGAVVEYQAGSTKAYQILQTPGGEADGMDFDLQGNLYVAYRGVSGTGSIDEFPPGSTQGTSLGMTLNQPQGLVVDNSANILAAETGGTNRVDVFAPGSQTPELELDLPSSASPTQLTISVDEGKLFVTAWNNGDIYATLYPLSQNSAWVTKDDAQTTIQGMALTRGQVF